MESDPLRYDTWIEDALRSVIRRALGYVAENGLPGEHHFYITYRTDGEGVETPGYLKAEHPDEMTIVLQHQFEDLAVNQDAFWVTLRFNGKPERLRVPFNAVVSFADPSVNFGLQLKMTTGEHGEAALEKPMAQNFDLGTTRQNVTADSEAAVKATGQIIALDAFRKK
jgi:hypothetical protein